MLAEVEAIKDVPLDTFTKKAVTFKKGLQEVLNNVCPMNEKKKA